MITYEAKLDADTDWAFQEGSMYFDEGNAVFKALRQITRRLDDLGIDYAIVGGLALFKHGYRRFTEDVGLLVTPENLEKIHEHLDGLGYLPPFKGSKHLRDTQHGVKIEFLVTGQYPGDGKPKPIPFPDPADVAVDIDGVKVLRLATLIDLKLASGMTNPLRGQDLIDVQRLIQILGLPRSTADELNPYGRERFLQIWQMIQDNPDLHEQG